MQIMPHLQTNQALGLPVQKLGPYALQASDKTITLPLQICCNASCPNLSRLINGSLFYLGLCKKLDLEPAWPLIGHFPPNPLAGAAL